MNKEELKEKISEAFSKIELLACVVCGELISRKEYADGDGACGKCWEK